MFCDNNKCVKYYSLNIGSVTYTKTNGIAIGCASGFAVVNENYFTCAVAPTSNSLSNLCSLGSNCTDSTGVYSKPCSCGLNGNSYCPSFEGDSYLQNAIKNFQKISNLNCSYSIGVSPGCYQKDLKSLLAYYYYETNLTMFTSSYLVEGYNNDCQYNTYVGGYFNGLKMISLVLNEIKDSFATIMKLGLLGIITIFY